MVIYVKHKDSKKLKLLRDLLNMVEKVFLKINVLNGVLKE